MCYWLLVIEVADTSIEHDRTVKLPLYAQNGINECWLIDVNQRCVEVHRSPATEGYQKVDTYTRDTLSPMFSAAIEASITNLFSS